MKSYNRTRGRKSGFKHSEEYKLELSKRARIQQAIKRGYREYQALENNE